MEHCDHFYHLIWLHVNLNILYTLFIFFTDFARIFKKKSLTQNVCVHLIKFNSVDLQIRAYRYSITLCALTLWKLIKSIQLYLCPAMLWFEVPLTADIYILPIYITLCALTLWPLNYSWCKSFLVSSYAMPCSASDCWHIALISARFHQCVLQLKSWKSKTLGKNVGIKTPT